MKLDLLTNATVVDDAIRFVPSKSKENLKSSLDNSNEDYKESHGPNYNKDEGKIDEEQEEEAGEMTINQVF